MLTTLLTRTPAFEYFRPGVGRRVWAATLHHESPRGERCCGGQRHAATPDVGRSPRLGLPETPEDGIGRSSGHELHELNRKHP
jgi:hypothetical protein